MALGGSRWLGMALQSLPPALSWSSLYSLATLPLLHASSLHEFYGGCSKFFSFFIPSRSILFLWNLGKLRPCSFFFFKDLEKKKTLFTFFLLTDASHLHDSEKMKARRSWDIDCKNGLKSFYLISVPLAM